MEKSNGFGSINSFNSLEIGKKIMWGAVVEANETTWGVANMWPLGGRTVTYRIDNDNTPLSQEQMIMCLVAIGKTSKEAEEYLEKNLTTYLEKAKASATKVSNVIKFDNQKLTLSRSKFRDSIEFTTWITTLRGEYGHRITLMSFRTHHSLASLEDPDQIHLTLKKHLEMGFEIQTVVIEGFKGKDAEDFVLQLRSSLT